MAPSIPHGKVCYLEIPAPDGERAAAFYEAVFGWRIRRHDDGRLAFDDATADVSGTWVGDRPPSGEPGVLVYVMVDSVEQTLRRIVDRGGEIVTPCTSQGPGEAF